MTIKHSAVALFTALALAGCNSDSSNDDGKTLPVEGVKVAFMPDIHFHDVYGDFQDGSFDGLYNSQSGQGATIRTMMSQMKSTRLFNENYFAMIAALDDIVARGIKYVALPGDFSDDGQPVHMRGLVKIFDQYREEHGLEFFAAPGNHDPVRPFTQPAGKSDYLGRDGHEQRIFSKGKDECVGYEGDWTIIPTDNPLPTICTEEVKEWGYKEIMGILSHHGFDPQPEYKYFETPYSSDEARKNYSYDVALQEANYANRMYEICHEGTGGEHKEDSYTACSMVPDSTYLVEPIEGLWLMAIDANVYRPKADSTGGENNPGDYDGSSSAGYNMMLTHKAHVVEWISNTVKAAKEQNKVLLSFSHFPMTDFYNGASEEIEDIFGEGNFQLARQPEDDTSKALAKTGLSIHVGGHMHFNDTGMKQYNIDGETYTLFNIQAPSLAGYIPAYKVLEIKPNSQVEVETVVLENVPRFNELFEHYAKEHDQLVESGAGEIWNSEILDAESYYELTDWHIKELTRLRFLPEEWPQDIKNMLFNMDGKQMLILSQLETDITVCQLKEALGLPCVKTDGAGAEGQDDLNDFIQDWSLGKEKAEELANQHGMALIDFAEWDGEELAIDFYRLRNADELAFRDIEPSRLPQYKLLSEELYDMESEIHFGEDYSVSTPVGDVFKVRFGTLFYILDRFATGEASDNFLIDVEQGTLTDLKTVADRESLQ
ncbi:metallophosphoesterase [Photobacterium rosenbergii]|uniref:Metallophosphoesterase n=1 Tax=Photobacterium rosenbergii TaxID=294936 RepID=A0ABU3ZDE7_9GAMM|nr:metallophosphoesterase [Photobacterium rosenbergii]MDV5168132.1 metallophosphoesterase [Photobacterium rosenbergii]